MNHKMSKPSYYLLSFSLLGFAFLVIVLATKWGIGLTPDSIAYIQGAKGILKNIDFADIGTHYPPLYFALLALSSLFFESILLSARYLHIFIFVANALLFAYLIKSKTQSQSLFILGLSIFISAAATFQTHVMAWSEPIFITFMLLNFHFFSEYLWKGRSLYLILAGVFAALAFLTRYVGITLVITCLYIILIHSQQQLKERLKKAFLFGLVSGVPIFFWLLHNITSVPTLIIDNRVTS
ncbi:MAG: glycosyltransferase family 39 protein [Desulfobacterales bacterium]